MADDNARLRDAFAQLLAVNGQGPVVSPIEALWAQQGQRQLPPPPGPPLDPSKDFTGQAGTSMPRPQAPPGLNFPTAPAAPQSLLGGPREAPKPPFPGAKSVETRPYPLPKSDKKKKSQKDEG
jgi:hypothetical protein